VQYAEVDRDVRPPVDQAEQRGANAPLLTLDDPFASASRVCAQVRRTDSGSRVELASKLPAAKAPSCDMPVSGLRAAAVTRPQNVRVFARNPRAPPQRSFTP
jgi:hypothetical protein